MLTRRNTKVRITPVRRNVFFGSGRSSFSAIVTAKTFAALAIGVRQPPRTAPANSEAQRVPTGRAGGPIDRTCTTGMNVSVTGILSTNPLVRPEIQTIKKVAKNALPPVRANIPCPIVSRTPNSSKSPTRKKSPIKKKITDHSISLNISPGRKPLRVTKANAPPNATRKVNPKEPIVTNPTIITINRMAVR